MKNAHQSRASRDYPVASPSRGRGNKSLLIRRDAVRPSDKLDGVTRSCDLFVTTSPPHPSSLRRTVKYVSLLRISGALHLGIFEQPERNDFFSSLEDFTNSDTGGIESG